MENKSSKPARKQALCKTDVSRSYIPEKVSRSYIPEKLERCDCCDNILDEFAEYGTCFDCLMNSSIAGQYNQLMD